MSEKPRGGSQRGHLSHGSSNMSAKASEESQGMEGAEKPQTVDAATSVRRTRDSAVARANTASGAATPKDPAPGAHAATRRHRITAFLAVLTIAAAGFSAWSMGEYAAGRDPLAIFAIAQETAAPSWDDAASDTAGASGDGAATEAVDVSGDAAAAGSDTAEAPAASVEDVSAGQAGGSGDSEPPASGGTSSLASGSAGAGAAVGGSSGGSSGAAGSAGSGGSSGSSQPGDASTIAVTQVVDGASQRVTVAAGSSVYDVLAASGVPFSASGGAFGAYVTAINGQAAGPNTGWTYTVNGAQPNVSCSSYEVSIGDAIVWEFVTVG